MTDPLTWPLLIDGSGSVLRLLDVEDAQALADAHTRNRGHLAPWEPTRPDIYYDVAGQTAAVTHMQDCLQRGTHVPLVIARGDTIIGAVTISDIVHGSFHNGHLGYWLDHGHVGRGLMHAAVANVILLARDVLGLHRLQAAVMPRNERSRALLERSGFRQIGVALRYMNIAGERRDHVLYELIL